MATMTDTFTAADGTNVEAHTVDTGETVSEHTSYTSGNSKIQSNRAYCATASSCLYYSWVPASAEYDVTVEMRCVSGVGNQGPAGRIDTSANTMYFARWDATAAGWQLFRIVSGTATQIGSTVSFSPTPGNDYTVLLEIRDATKRVLVGGVEQISNSNNTITAAGKAGFRASTAVTTTTGFHINTLTAADPAGSGQTLSPSSIDSTAAIGAPTLAPGAVTLTPAGIASTAALGAPTLTPGAVTLTPAGIASTAAVGTPTLAPGGVTLTPAGIDSTAAVGEPSLSTGGATVSPDSITSGEAIGTPALLPGGVTLTPTALDSTVTLGSPALVPGGVAVSPASIAPGSLLGTPLINVIVQPAGWGGDAAVGAPTVVPGGVMIAPVGLLSTPVIGSPTLTGGAVAAPIRPPLTATLSTNGRTTATLSSSGATAARLEG